MLHWTKNGLSPLAQADGDGVSFVDMAFLNEEIGKLRAAETQRMIRGLARFVRNRILHPVNVWMQRQRLYEELSYLNDRTLADLGVDRATLRAKVAATLPYSRDEAAANASPANPFLGADVTPVASNEEEAVRTPLAA